MKRKSMKKVTKIAVAFLAVMMVFALSGCKKGGTNGSEKDGDKSSERKEITQGGTNGSEKDGDKFVKELEPLVEKLETAANDGVSEDFDKIYAEISALILNGKNAHLAYEDYSSDENYKKETLLMDRINKAAEESKKKAEESMEKIHIIIPEENLTYQLNSDSTGVIITGTKNWNDSWKKRILEIPTAIQGFPVKEIGGVSNAVFGYLDYCEGIIIPDGINLKKEAFYKFPGKFVRLPDTLKTIPEGCFRGASIESIEIPKTVKEIDAKAFTYCENLKEVIIPENVEKINDEAFFNSGIQSLVLLSKNISFGNEVFSCNNLTTVEIPEGVSSYFTHGYLGVNNLGEVISGNKLPLATVAKLKQIKLIKK